LKASPAASAHTRKDGRVARRGAKAVAAVARRSRLIWTAPALEDLEHIASWIAVENERAASDLVR